MYDKSAARLTIFTDIGKVEALRHQEVVLHGECRILFAVRILHLNIYLRAIEGCFSLCLFKLNATFFHCVSEQRLRFLPHLFVAGILLLIIAVTERKTVAVISAERQTEHAIYIFDEVKGFFDLLDCLLLTRADDMSVREAKSTHSLEPHELTRLFIAKELGELGDTHGELAVAVRPGEIELKMVRAGHRPQHELLIVYLDRRIHRVSIVGVVARLFIQIELCDLRRIHVLIPTPRLFVDDKTLELTPYDRSLRGEQGQAFADGVGENEQIELRPKLFVVPLLFAIHGG